MPRVGSTPAPPRPRPVSTLAPGTPFASAPWAGRPGTAPEDWAPTVGVFVEMAGGDARVLVGDRTTYWSAAAPVIPTGPAGSAPVVPREQARPAGPSREERRQQIAIAEHAAAVERSAPRQLPVVQTVFGEEC